MHLNADGLMNTSLTERGGLPLLAAWLAGASVCAVFALIACFALPVVFSAQGGQIFSWVWRPDTHEFGILPMIVGSLLLSVSALLLSWPLAVGVACAIQDGGKKRLFGCTVAGIVRFMTTIPTVVYGFAAVFLLVPVVREAAGKGPGLCWLSAALMLALLILPTMVLVMDSAMRTKERNVRITAAALGFTRSQTLACLVLPASRRWLLTAAILGFGRAVGDTLIPLMLTGNAPHVPESLFGSLQKLPPSPSNLSMHLNADGLMNTSLTERGGLPLLAAWLAGASVCAVFALIACFALPVVFSAQGGQIFSWVWRPDTHEFGILPMIVGSLLLSVSALLLSWPLAVGVACAIQDGGKKRLFGCTVAGIVRFMTTIPTVVYGFAAVFLLVPVVREAAGKGPGLCWLSAALMLALLILPTMVLVMDSAMRTKERNVRITAAALGFTRSQTLACLVLPASRRWLLTAAILGFGRAVGDTLIPLMLTGNAPHVPESLFGSLRTLTAHMGLVTATEVGGPAYNSLFVAGGLLLLTSACVSLALRKLASESGEQLPEPPALWRRYAPSALRPLSIVSGATVASAIVCLLGFLLYRGLPTLGPSLLFGDTPPLRALLGTLPVWDGIWPACAGTFCLIVTTMLLAIGPGIGCGIYLAEYASPSMKRLFGVIMDILAGIPSIVMGIFGFTLILFLHRLGVAGASPGILLAGGCLALLVLPSLVVTTRTALEGLPASLRLTGFALGLTHSQIVRHILVPQASRGILGGIMLAMGRAAEDTAVILLTGVVANAGLPSGLAVRFEALPFFIYYTAAQYQTPEELERGFGASLTLLLLSGGLLLAAWWLHARYQRRKDACSLREGVSA